MLQNVENFLTDFENYFAVAGVPENEIEEAGEQYRAFENILNSLDCGKIGVLEYGEDKESQDNATKTMAILGQFDKVVTSMIEYHDPAHKKVKSIGFILKKPVETEGETAQQKALKKIDNIRSIEVSQWPVDIEITDGQGNIKYVKKNKDIPEGWQKTGRYHYQYNGKTILTESVSNNVNGYDPNADYPILAAPIGTHVDKVGRLFFDKESILFNKNGNLVSDDQLEEIIYDELGGIFTVQGLKNLIDDFNKLEKQFQDKWGKDIKIFSGEIDLFGKTPDSDLWIHGKPDLLVVDRSGIVHVIDFKTSKMIDIRGYQQVLHDSYGTSEKYGKQVSRYIRMLESYGLKVDNEPYIVLIDTWYNSSDHGKRNRDSKGNPIEGRSDIYTIGEDGSLNIGEQSLGEYAEENPATRDEILIEDKEILYMEPRLHVEYEEGVGFSEELAALRGKEDIPFDTEVSYEQQLNALSDQERQELQWLFNTKPVLVKTAQGIVTLSENDIEGRPDLISSQEIQDVADFMMYRVSRIISGLQRGIGYREIDSSMPNADGTPSTVFLGRDRSEIIRIAGIDNLIEIAFKSIKGRYHSDFPSEQDYKDGNYDNDEDFGYNFADDADYQHHKRMNDKAKWLIDHKEQFIMAGYAKLMALENSIIPKRNKSKAFNPATPDTRMDAEDMEAVGETGDEESNQSFADLYLEGITDVEAWMLGQRNYSPKASLAQEIKRMFEDIDMLDSNGNKVMDPYGWGFSMALDATMAIQTVLDTCKHCETIEEMMAALKNLARNPQNSWVNQVIDTINMKGNENLKKKFFRHFRKDALNYSIAQAKFNKKTGKRVIETRIVNMKSAYETITQSLGASFRNGQVGSYTVSGVTFSVVQRDAAGNNVLTKLGKGTVAGQIRKDIAHLKFALEDLYKGGLGKPEGVTAFVAENIQKQKFKVGNERKTIIQAVTDILNGIGIRVPEDVVMNTCLKRIGKGPKTNNAATLLRYAGIAVQHLMNMDTGKGIPDGLKGNDAGRGYFPILNMVADSVQEFVEASVYQDGKTYFSYINPSRLGHIIRNLKDSLNDPEKFEKYIQDNFGRYTGWFKSVDGSEWLCDWVRQFAEAGGSKALSHKVELSYLNKQYRDLGALGFQLSILHNYFGSRDDRETNKDYRWFALPTMSNKPTNEFIRMLKYKDTDEIIDKVLMNTFKQEMNRMADVLYHFAYHSDSVATDQIDLTEKKLIKAGWSKEDISRLVNRIKNRTLTAGDLIRLQSITSGAKFHFLWYLNNDIAGDDVPEFGSRIAERLNLLLTPDGDVKQNRLSESNEADTLGMVRKVISYRMNKVVESELSEMKKIGLFDTEIKKVGGREVKVLKYQEEFDERLGPGKYGYDEAVKEMEDALRDFIWQDIAANINIIQITGGDLAFYGNAVNYQKRIAQIHSPGLKLMHDDQYDDGYLRSVHISDEMVRDEILHNTETALTEYMNNSGMSTTAKADYKKMISIILDGLTRAEATDGQSYSSPTSIRKKLALQGEWDDNKEKAYQAIIRGDFNINHLGVMLQPSKPFVTSDMAKYSGSPTMELRRTPLQDKNSEYLIVLAEALARGAGQKSKMVAICDFMETTHKYGNGKTGIDTVHFSSVNKVGKSGVIDIAAFDREFEQMKEDGYVDDSDYNEWLRDYLLEHVRTVGMGSNFRQNKDDFEANERLVREGKLKREEALYNSQYVDTIPLDDYIIQQEVPAHMLEHQQLYGSQIRILGISDITPGTEFQVNGRTMTDSQLVDEYKALHAQNIRESFEDLMKELGLDKLSKNGKVDITTIDGLSSEDRNQVYKNLEFLLQKELSKDAKYGLDMRRACALQYDRDGNVIDFNVPLMDPIQSRRIQELINSIIKKSINKQRITGGPVVQTTAYDNNLHIRFKGKNGEILPTYDEWKTTVPSGSPEGFKQYLKDNQAGIAYFECYMPVPNAQLERLMLKPDGSMMSFEELQKKLPKDVFDSMMQVIGYRIPTEDKYSMLPLKIMGFVPKAAGQVIMMPQEITYLTGSDFDIDKMYIMMKAFDVDMTGATKEQVQSIADIFMSKTNTTPFRKIKEIASRVIENGNKIMNGENISWSNGITRDESWEKAQKFIEWYRDYILQDAFIEYTNQETPDRRDNRKARDNRILDLQWAVLTNEDTTSKMLNPGNFNDQKKVGRIIRILKSEIANPETGEIYTYEQLNGMDIDKLDTLLENANPHNTTLPSSKIYFQRQNMQGSQMVGIFANNNVSHAFMTFQKVGINLYKGRHDNTFSFDGVLIGDPDNPTVLDPQKGFNGQLISKNIASFLAASVDTAKDPVLSDLNVNTFTGGVAMVLARLGFDTASIGLFLSQPVIMQLSDLYFKNSTEGFYTGDTAIEELAELLGMKKDELQDTDGIKDETLSRENFIQHLNDTDYDDADDNFQKRVLQGFYRLYQISHDLIELTFCTKFNSVSNAVGPTIADTMEDLDRVNRFINNENSVFYIPESDNDPRGFTNHAEVILNDPILSAFFESTVDTNGASDKIFRNLFPHYFNGFQNVKDYFQENFLGGKKLNSKLLNQLLNEYMYYLMTYEDDDYRPTLPYSWQHKDRLVSKLIGDFQAILKLKDRKPNLILDQGLGNNCLRVRSADEFLSVDTLVFNNSQLNTDGQQKIRNAWSDLITYEDEAHPEDAERIRRFGVDLFFYNLMRNGFTFSPKTMMTLASVVVRYNATYFDGYNNYIDGLKSLRDLDEFLMNDSDNMSAIKQFCNQFVRNHANNRQLVPSINFEDNILLGVDTETGEVEFGADKKYKLAKILPKDGEPRGFITVIRKDGGRLTQELYELEEVGGQKVNEEGGMFKIMYKKSSKLGFTNNFIEYDANSSLDISYFEGIRKESVDDMDDETPSEGQAKDEQTEISEGSSNNNGQSEEDSEAMINLWIKARREMLKFSDNQFLKELKKVYLQGSTDSELSNAFSELLTAESEKKQGIMDRINEIFKKENKC